jgi:hypothetical protein
VDPDPAIFFFDRQDANKKLFLPNFPFFLKEPNLFKLHETFLSGLATFLVPCSLMLKPG